MTPNEKRRPAGNGTALDKQAGGPVPSLPPTTDSDIERCRRCQHPISAPTSLARHHGPECWRRLVLGSLRAAAAGEWHARLDVDSAGRVVSLLLVPRGDLRPVAEIERGHVAGERCEESRTCGGAR